ncbi:hypothetical protein YC2023_010695 [Brassica napus]
MHAQYQIKCQNPITKKSPKTQPNRKTKQKSKSSRRPRQNPDPKKTRISLNSLPRVKRISEEGTRAYETGHVSTVRKSPPE